MSIFEKHDKDLGRYLAVNQYRYYYDALELEHKHVYEQLLTGYLQMRERFNVNCIDINVLWDIHRSLCYDVPEMFYIKSLKAAPCVITQSLTIYVEYRFSFDEITNIFEAMQKEASVLRKRISMMTEIDKIKSIHDYIIRGVKYKDLEAPYSHEAPGTIIYGIGVCEGISKAFKYYADRTNIKCILAVGSASDNGSGKVGGHAWNIVFVNEHPYHLDVTFDYSMSTVSSIRYDYFLLSDTEMSRDHSYEKNYNCNNSINYYQYLGAYAMTRKELCSAIKEKLRPNKNLIIKLPDSLQEVADFADIVLESVSAAVPVIYAINYKISMSYNWARMVFSFELIRTI